MHPKISSKGKKKNNLISSTNLIERETDGRETHRLKDLNSRERTIFGSGFEQAVFKVIKGQLGRQTVDISFYSMAIGKHSGQHWQFQHSGC